MKLRILMDNDRETGSIQWNGSKSDVTSRLTWSHAEYAYPIFPPPC